MRANWWGIAGEKLDSALRPAQPNEVISGIPGSPTDHHGVALRAHRGVRRRLPDASAHPRRLHASVRSASDAVLQERTFEELGVLTRRASA